MPSNIVSASDVDSSIFDYQAHLAKGEKLTAELAAAQQALAEAEAFAEAAREAEEELDLATDSNSRIARVRLDLERAEAKRARAGQLLRAAERGVARTNSDRSLAEELLPMVARTVGNHPGFTLYALPGDPSWENLTAPSLVLVQPSRAIREPDGRVHTEGISGTSGDDLRLAYVHDAGLHRKMPTGDDLIRAANAFGVNLQRPSSGVGQAVRGNAFPTNSRELKNGLTLSILEFPASVFPKVPAIEDGYARVDIAQATRSIAERVGSHLPDRSQIDVRSLAVNVSISDGLRVTTVKGRVFALDQHGQPLNGEVGSAVARLVGTLPLTSAVGRAGRVVEAAADLGGEMRLVLHSLEA